MSDVIESKVNDEYKEHRWHQSVHGGCSDCYNEETKRMADRANSHQELLKRHPALKNPHGSNYPLGYKPD